MKISTIKTVLILLAFLLVSLSAKLYASGSLVLSPEHPKEFDTISLTFTPDGRFDNPDSLFGFIYCFNEFKPMPDAYEIPLKKLPGQSKFVGKFTLPDFTVFGMIKIFGYADGEAMADNNQGKMWDFMVFDSEKPLRSANLKAGLSYLGNMPENYSRTVDFKKALDYLEQEIKLYPNNIQAQIGLTSLRLDLKKMSYDEFAQVLGELVKKDYDRNNENDIRAVSRALRALNENKQADKLENEFAEKHPESKLAVESLLSKLSSADSFKKFIELSVDYFDKYPSSNSRGRIFSAFVSSFLQLKKFDQLMKILDKIRNIPPTVYTQIAGEIISNPKLIPDSDKKQRYDEAIKICNLAMRGINEENYRDVDFKLKPSYLTPKEWAIQRTHIYGGIYETRGDIYLLQQDTANAIKSYQQAIDSQGGMAGVDLFEKIISLSQGQGDDKAALGYCNDAILRSMQTDELLKQQKRLSEKLLSLGKAAYKKYLDSLQKEAKIIRLEKLKYQTVDLPEVTGVFERLNGTFVDIEDMRGKIIMLTFWSTWCGPCQSMFPAIGALYEKYADSSDVVIASVNLWEKEGDRKEILDKFLEKAEANFPIYIDQTDIIPRKYGILGLPTTVFIDKSGKIKFKVIGFTNTDDFILESIDKIDFLNSDWN